MLMSNSAFLPQASASLIDIGSPKCLVGYSALLILHHIMIMAAAQQVLRAVRKK